MSAIVWPLPMSEDDYTEHCDSYNGVCLGCGEIRFSGVEPDAEDYPCEECGEMRVCGVEQALLLGRIEVVE